MHTFLNPINLFYHRKISFVNKNFIILKKISFLNKKLNKNLNKMSIEKTIEYMLH